MLSLQELVINHDWYLHLWQVRYGNGLYAMIAPSTYHINQIREISTGGDIEAVELDSYLNNEGSWLPIVSGMNLEESLKKLEDKVFFDNPEWRKAVHGAFECIIENNDGSYGLRIALDNKEKALFKPIEEKEEGNK